MSIYAIKSDLKKATGIDTSKFAKWADVPTLKSKVNKLGSLPTDLSKLSNVVKNEVVKNVTYNELVLKKLILFKLLMLVI